MKRLLTICMLCVLLCAALAVPAAAENAGSRAELYCTVNSEGTCLYSLNMNLHIDNVDADLKFPLPAGAADIKLNGNAVVTSAGTDCILVDLASATDKKTGDFPLRFDYTIKEVVTVEKIAKIGEKQFLAVNIPMLSGFEYPITSMNFVITLPEDVPDMPNFHSIYQQNGFDADLDLSINGNMVTGTAKRALRDHESVRMSMQVPREMFPSVSIYQREGNPELIPMGICAGLALLYWLLFLRNLPFAFTRSTTPPAGVSAGELGCRMTMTGGDLTMMVLTWAQLGYLVIRPGNGKVLLYKRMDMGNERSLFEIRVFQALFVKRPVVDCGSMHYAKLCQRTAAMIPGEKAMCRPGFRNKLIFRLFLLVAQVFCAICIAMNMTVMSALQVVFSIVFSIIGIPAAWLLQNMAYCTHSRKRFPLVVGSIAGVIWVGLGVLARQPWIPLGAVVAQYLAGFLLAYGGRRTDRNRTECSEILGLRRYLKNLPRPEANRLAKVDPDYFFRMAPYAIAMGVGKPFAEAFGKKRFEQCPYFATNIQGLRSASEWMRLMNQTVAVMDSRYNRMRLEKWLAVRFR